MKKNIYLKSVVETGATQFAVEYMRNFPLEKLVQVKINPLGGGWISASFIFETNPNMGFEIEVRNAFCVGYRGEGPWGLHDIMIAAGFDEYTASRVFEISREEETILEK